ncbi:MAG: hypothetical protein ACR2QE_02040, partial [Acidimicrobiales bacterium]
VVGFGLIVIKGRSTEVDICLNFSGMLAPLVAVVPTTNVGNCWSVEPPAKPLNSDGTLATWVVANIDNNIRSLIFAGVLGIAAWIGAVALSKSQKGSGVGSPSPLLPLIGTVVFVGAVWSAFHWWGDFNDRAHGLAAVGLFIFLAAAVALNAWELRSVKEKRFFLVVYLLIFVAMLLAALPMAFSSWDHNVLIVEAVEIGLFGLFWFIQTIELWHTTSAPQGSP